MEIRRAGGAAHFSGWRFLRLMTRWGSFAGALIGLGLLALGNGNLPFWGALAVRSFFGLYCGFLVAAVVAWRFESRERRKVEGLGEIWGDLGPLRLESRGPVVHHRGRYGSVMVGGAEGQLFLTGTRLVFRTSASRGRLYEMSIPLGEVTRAEVRRPLGFFANVLSVGLSSGGAETFVFPLREDATGWVDALLAAGAAAGPRSRTPF